MEFLKNMFKKSPKNTDNEPVFVVGISNTVLCEIYMDLLKENNIPYICRQNGAGGYIKVLTGGFLVTDNIYVKKENYNKARELYDNYIDGKAELSDSEEQ